VLGTFTLTITLIFTLTFILNSPPRAAPNGYLKLKIGNRQRDCFGLHWTTFCPFFALLNRPSFPPANEVLWGSYYNGKPAFTIGIMNFRNAHITLRNAVPHDTYPKGYWGILLEPKRND